MLNLDETLILNSRYNTPRDFYIRAILYSIGVVFLIDYLRAQIAEINLLQLIPGFYLILVFFSFLLLVSLSDSFFRIPLDLDNKKECGTKTDTRMELTILVKFGVYLLFLLLYLVLTYIVPISFDSFEVYEQKSLENLWSFEEVINLEVNLIVIVVALAQVPNLTIFYLTTEKENKILPEFWKDFSFLIFLISGIITPTIDGYTQLSFSFSGIALYLIIINILEKRLRVKSLGGLSLNF